MLDTTLLSPQPRETVLTPAYPPLTVERSPWSWVSPSRRALSTTENSEGGLRWAVEVRALGQSLEKKLFTFTSNGHDSK